MIILLPVQGPVGSPGTPGEQGSEGPKVSICCSRKKALYCLCLMLPREQMVLLDRKELKGPEDNL